MVRNREEAARASERQTRNSPGTCQMVTRGWFDAPSAGDRDRDKDADANDGWLSEPVSARRYDRNPPRGVPLYFKNRNKTGPSAFGHRSMSRGGGNGRSTDMSNGRYAPGITGNATIAQIEAAMGLTYVGWSTTITGIPIPLPPAPVAAVKSVVPRKTPARWNKFVHLDSSEFMDYLAGIKKAQQLGIGIDIDGQKSKQGTGWGAHWATVGKNRLHDPQKKIKSTARLDSLTDAEIDRLRGPKGQKGLRRLSVLLGEASRRGVRVELETKVLFSDAWVTRLMNLKTVKSLHQRHLLQIKVLASMSSPLVRLMPWHKRGAITIVSFTGYKGKGLSKKRAFPIVDYYRGTAKWVA